MPTKTDTAHLAQIVKDAAEGIDSIANIRVRDDYSGRFMNGKTCLAVTLDDPGTLVALGMSIAYTIACGVDQDVEAPEDAIDDMIQRFAGARTDSLGRDTVVYWPSIKTED